MVDGHRSARILANASSVSSCLNRREAERRAALMESRRQFNLMHMSHGSACLRNVTENTPPLFGSEPIARGDTEHGFDAQTVVSLRPRDAVHPSPNARGLDATFFRECPSAQELIGASHEGALESDASGYAGKSHAFGLASPNVAVKSKSRVNLTSTTNTVVYMRKRHTTDLTPEQNERVRVAIRAYMNESDLTQRQMARMLDLTPPSLSAILSGKNGAGTRTAMRVANILSLPYEDFVSPNAPPPPASEPRLIDGLNEEDPRAAGFRSFAEFVEDELPELLPLIDDFRRESGALVARHPLQTDPRTRREWKEQWKNDFRAWRTARVTGNVGDVFPGARRLKDDDENDDE